MYYSLRKPLKQLDTYIKTEEMLQRELAVSLNMELPIDLTNEKVHAIIQMLDDETAGDVLETLMGTPQLPKNVISIFESQNK